MSSLVNNCVSGLNVLNASFAAQGLSSSGVLSPRSSSCVDSAGSWCAPTGSSVGVRSQVQECCSASSPNAVQLRALQAVRNSVSRLCRRPAPAVCDDFSRLRSFPGVSTTMVSGYGAFGSCLPPVPLVADRVSLPSSVGTASLLDLLPAPLASLYADPSRVVTTTVSSANRRAFVHGGRSEYLKLVMRMHAAGMVTFLSKPAAVNSVFCVEKADGALRLILDARAANAAHVVPPPVELPTPDLLAGLQADGSGRPLFCAGTDLSDYYYRLRLPDWLVPYFAMPSVRVSELPFLSGAPGDRLFPAFLVLPMGWSHSVFVAQQVHENVIYTRTSLQRADAVAKGNDTVIDRVRHSIYIDDVNMFGYCESELTLLQDEYIAALASVGLPVKPSKVTRPTTDPCNVLGLSFSGSELALGIDGEKLQRLRARTFALLHARCASGVQLAAVVGSWTWFMLTRRPTLAVFNNVYRFAQVAKGCSLPLWPSVRAELAVVMSLAPLLVADLRPVWFPHLLASDASSTGLGVVRSRLVPEDVRVVASLAPLPAVSQPVPSVPSPQPPVLAVPVSGPSLASPMHGGSGAEGEMVAVEEQRVQRARDLSPLLAGHQPFGARQWVVVASSRWKRPEPINSLEARAVSTALRFASSCPSGFNARVALLCDSTAVVGALAKGRTSSVRLLRRVRSVNAVVLACHIRVHVVWVPTAVNPADGPSRL